MLRTNISRNDETIDTNEAFTQKTVIGKLKEAFNSKITTETCNGKQCYKIETMDEYYNSHVVYVDKETFNTVKTLINSQNACSYEFQTGTVTDEQMSFPDLANYEFIDETK